MKRISIISIEVVSIDEEDAAEDVEYIINKNTSKPITLGLSEEQAIYVAFHTSQALQDRAYTREMENDEKINAMITRTQKACREVYKAGRKAKDEGYEL